MAVGYAMTFRLRYDKAVQATGHLLRQTRVRRMNSMKLLQLLYIADRESLGETGQPIVGGRLGAIARGPILSDVYDLIRGRRIEAPNWDSLFRKDHYELELCGDVGVGALSKYELDKLNEVFRRYEDLDEWDMANVVRELPEWQPDNPNMLQNFPLLLHILEAAGLADDAESIAQDAEDRRIYDVVFGG